MSMPFYASAEQIMRDRSEFARKGIARGRSVVVLDLRRRRPVRRRERQLRAAQGQRDLRPHRLRRASASTTSTRTCGWPASGSPTCAATPTTAATSPPARWPTPTPRRSARSSPSSRSPTRSRSASPRSANRRAEDQLYRLTYDGTIVDEPEFLVMGGQAEALTDEMRDRASSRPAAARGAGRRGAAHSARPAGRTATRARCRPASSRWPCSTAPAGSASSGGSPGSALTELLPPRPPSRTEPAEPAAGEHPRETPSPADADEPVRHDRELRAAAGVEPVHPRPRFPDVSRRLPRSRPAPPRRRPRASWVQPCDGGRCESDTRS